MYSKIIFVLVTVCVVNASVITVNIFDDDTTTEVKASPSRCNSKVCDWLCRRFNKTSGTCVNGYCKCEKSLIAEDDAETEVKASPSRCNSKACDWLCRRLNKTNGTCVEGHCKCGKPLTAEDAINEWDNSVSLDDDFFSTEEFETRRTCRISKCNRKCSRRGYEGATCVEGRCKCYKNPEKSLPVSELSEDQSERSCNMQACDQLCRRLKFPSGVCVNGRCKCDNFLGIEANAVDEYSGLATRRVCHVEKCNRTCTRRGYVEGRCINGRCLCYDKIKNEDTYVVNDESMTSNESDESNEISNEEELKAPSLSACNAATCNQWCRRLKYAGGWCRFGQCQCF